LTTGWIEDKDILWDFKFKWKSHSKLNKKSEPYIPKSKTLNDKKSIKTQLFEGKIVQVSN